jgi:GPH family glycoside/pentoside/hexuronide:cation symporter
MPQKTFTRVKPFFYGLSDLGPSCIDIFIKVYLLLYFNVILGLSPSLTSLAIGMGVLWDALIDPWIGVFSDKYYHKHGHRKGIIYLATFSVVFLFYILWRIPPGLGEKLTFTFLFLVSSLLNSSISLYSVPYMAIANDLVKDNEARKRWTGWRVAFLNIGAFVGLSVPAYFLIKDSGAEYAADLPYLHATTALVLIMLVCSFITIFVVYHNEEFRPEDMTAVVHQKMRQLVSDPKFLRLLIAYFVVNCGIGLNSALALYYYKDYLLFSEKQTQIILVGFLAFFTLSIPFWIYLTRRYDKAHLITGAGFLLGAQTIICFPNFKGTDFLPIFLIAAGIGGFLIGVAVVLEIYLSDFLKEKEIETAQNVSGQYVGVWKMAAKISRAVAIALAGPVLEASADKQVLANYFGWGVGIFFILGAVIMVIPVQDKRIA